MGGNKQRSKADWPLVVWTLFLAAGFWLAHALLHWRFFYGGRFRDVVYRDIPPHDLVIRLVGVGMILVLGVILVGINRGQKKIMENQLRSEEMFRSVFACNPSGMALIDAKSLRFLNVNSSLEAIMGYSGDELKEMTIRDVIPPEDWREEAQRIDSDFRRTEKPFEYYIRYIRKDGSIRRALVTGEILPPGRRGDDAIALVVVMDVSENQQVMERIRESESRFRTLAETVPLGIEEVDSEGRIEWVNPAYCQMFKCRSQDAVGKFIWDWLPDPKPLRRFYKSLMRRNPPPKIWMGKNVVDQSDIMDVRVDWDYRRDAEGKVTGTVAVITDVTDEQRMQLMLQQARRMEAVGRLAGGVAHDLNNLLTPILGYAELLRERIEPGSLNREAVDEIHHAGSRSRDLVRQLLAFGRRQTMKFDRLDLNEVIRGLERILRYTIRENVRIYYKLTDHPIFIQADTAQLEQVLTNLAVNAQDAMVSGGDLIVETRSVTLDNEYIRTHPMVKPGEYAVLAVSDSGSGMDEETRERIFDPFFTTKENGKGTGLGLATIYGVVKQHDGYIWVYSELGKGSTFKIYLPRQRKGAVDKAESSPRPEESLSPRLEGDENIMVVEDDPMVRRLAAGMLRRLGYQVTLAASAEECLEKIAREDLAIDLLLSDVVMPGMNGSELFHRLRISHPVLKVLFMSGYTDTVISRNGLLNGNSEFLEKPFTLQGLAERVRRVLDE